MFDPRVSVNLLSLPCESLALHDRVVNAPLDALSLRANPRLQLFSRLLCLLLLGLFLFSLFRPSLLDPGLFRSFLFSFLYVLGSLSEALLLI